MTSRKDKYKVDESSPNFKSDFTNITDIEGHKNPSGLGSGQTEITQMNLMDNNVTQMD